ncbi:MAG: DegT/DnrJ/EryC1/StrS family aminotransferase [Actinomycetota bacterium]
MEVPFLDVGGDYRELEAELDETHRRVMRGGWFVLGEELAAFEREFATAAGAADACGVGNGLDALTLALAALDVGPGDEVIVPSMTFVATWMSVTAVGATPVPVDVDPASELLTVDAADAAVSDRTAAIVPVHLHGLPVDAPGFEELAGRRGLRLVFDAAQAHGATVAGRPVGSYGDASAWSFYPAKNLGAFGDGGAITFDDPELGERVRAARNYGALQRDDHASPGTNSRLDELQAAFLRIKLRRLEDWNERRARIADRYATELADLPAALPVGEDDRSPVWHHFVVRCDRRDELRDHLHRSSIGTGVHYLLPPHRQPIYAHLGVELPHADAIASSTLSIPMGPHLDDVQQERVIAAIRSFAW